MAVWTNRPEIVLFDEVEEILCRAVCNWAGVPLDDSESTRRTRELSAMVEGAGSVGPRNWRGQFLRARTERWARHLVGQARAGLIEPPEVSALRSEEHTSELQSLMRISYAVFCLEQKNR